MEGRNVQRLSASSIESAPVRHSPLCSAAAAFFVLNGDDAIREFLLLLLLLGNLLCDLGVSRVNKAQDQLMKTRVGTPLFLSPEVVMRRPYCAKVDIWAMGCLMYTMMVRSLPASLQPSRDFSGRS